MSKSKWLNEVAGVLRRQGLSGAYTRRFMDELADHCDDLCQETASMDANSLTVRLGSPEELAGRAVVEMRNRTYAGRHPFVTFVAAPLPTAALLLIALCLCFLLLLSVVPETPSADDRVPWWAATVMYATIWAMRYLPFIAAAILFCHAAKRSVCGSRWSFVACALVAVLAGLFAVNLTLPTSGPNSGSLTMGFAFRPLRRNGSKLWRRLRSGCCTPGMISAAKLLDQPRNVTR